MRTFLLMLGSAVGGVVIFVAVVYAYFWYQWSQVGAAAEVRLPPTRAERTVSVAPPIVDAERFYGSSGMYSGDFSPAKRNTVLTAGPGKLVGAVSSSGKPVEGLRVRLALNAAVMSQWATSGADGKYEVAVPYGTYRIDGYELDFQTAQRLLRGKIDGPRMRASRPETIAVTEGKPGEALDLAYVDPVRKKGPSGNVPAGKPVVFGWEPYPGASAYRLQIVEQKDPADYETHERLFPYRNQPVVTGTTANLVELGIKLKSGYYYTVEVEALDDNRRKLSEAPRIHDKSDFRIVD